ncbi:MAG TPA: tetratricopeptide repeat protein [Blastocatellia bacterium]
MEKLKPALPHAHIDKAPTFMNWLLTGWLFALATINLSCSGGALLDKAQTAWDNTDYAAAADYYEQFLKENPRSDKAEFARLKVATIYRRDLKKYDRAIEHYIHFIEEFPKSPDIIEARMRLGDCYGLIRKYREAIAEYESVLPKITDTNERRRLRLNIADMYFELNDRAQALAEYQKVVAGAPYDNLTERAYLKIGGIRLLRDEYEDAIPAFQTVASYTKDQMVRRAARFNIADCYERTLQYDQAIRVLEQIEPDPKSPNYIQQRIASIREQRRQRNLTTPFPRKRPSKQSNNQSDNQSGRE